MKPLLTLKIYLHKTELFNIKMLWHLTVLSLLILNWTSWIRTVWLNWIAWNRNVWQLNCLLMLNWIAWNRIIFIKMDLALNILHRLICHKTKQPTNSYSFLHSRTETLIVSQIGPANTGGYHQASSFFQPRQRILYLDECEALSRASQMNICSITPESI